MTSGSSLASCLDKSYEPDVFRRREGSRGRVSGNTGSICERHDDYFSIKSWAAPPTARTSPPSKVNDPPVWTTGILHPV